jgi:predicted O-linked N-acetylglucosamine transferase (SPINDLY family)
MSLSPAVGGSPSPDDFNALVEAAQTLEPHAFLVRAAQFGAVWRTDFAAQDFLGALYARLGRFDLAEPAFRAALAIRPDAPDTHLLLGVTLHELNRPEEACAELSRLPDHPEALVYLGLALERLKRFEEACAAFRSALARDPGHVRALNNLGACLMALRRYEEAEAALTRALALAPAYAEALLNLADVWIACGDAGRSVSLLERQLARDPGNPDFHARLGEALRRGGTPAEALKTQERAVALAPSRGEFHAALGGTWHAIGALGEALPHFERALALDPENAGILTDYALALDSAGLKGEAAAALERAHALDPDDEAVAAWLLGLRMHNCDWTGIAGCEEQLARLGTGEQPASPFALLALDTDPARHLQRARTYALRYKSIRPAPLTVPRSPDGRIRIGYFSADFHQHATMLLMAGVFRMHDRARFEITAYSFGPEREDDAHAALRRDVERFVDVRGIANAAVVELARSHGLDIAVELKGYTQHNRTELFAHRLAPVQVSWLGFPGTCGTDFHDYILGDSVVTPPEAQAHYSEQIIRLPGSYQCNDDARPIADWTPSRVDLGLPEGGFVFCSFNQLYKITPRMFAIWMRLLGAVPDSVLWLLRSNALAEANLRAAAGAAGIAPARLVFADREPNPRHLARLGQADLFLDSFPCNAHTTASDALWAGLPLVTLMGETFPSRVAASLLEACGLGELITHSEAEYEATALALARAPERLAALRARLSAHAALPLFQTERFTRDLERAWDVIHRRQIEGQAPSPLTLD